MKTFNTKPADIKREWYLVDAKGKTLGRLASGIARVLKGKHKVIYTPHLDTGDFVVVVNAEKIHVTGNKLDRKILCSSLGLSGRNEEGLFARAIGKTSGPRDQSRGVGDVAEGSTGSADVQEIESVRRHDSSAVSQKPKALEV